MSQLRTPNGESTINESEIQSNKMAPASLSLFITSHSYLFEIVWNTHRNFKLLLTLRERTSLYLRGPHPTRNVAKFHLLHPSPGSYTGLMCLKLPRCRARSQPAHDSCGCWGKTTTLIPQAKQLQRRQQSISQRGSGTQVLHEKVHPSVLISELHLDRITNSSQPNFSAKFFKLFYATWHL